MSKVLGWEFRLGAGMSASMRRVHKRTRPQSVAVGVRYLLIAPSAALPKRWVTGRCCGVSGDYAYFEDLFGDYGTIYALAADADGKYPFGVKDLLECERFVRTGDV